MATSPASIDSRHAASVNQLTPRCKRQLTHATPPASINSRHAASVQYSPIPCLRFSHGNRTSNNDDFHPLISSTRRFNLRKEDKDLEVHVQLYHCVSVLNACLSAKQPFPVFSAHGEERPFKRCLVLGFC